MSVAVARKYVGTSGVTDGKLGLSTNEIRLVRFHARVKEQIYPFRLALQTLGELVWSDSTWMSDEDFDRFMETVLDPVITVHDDRVFFEAFSQDESAYGVVIADRDIFEAHGEVQCGTTNIDFTTTLHDALATMRSSRETWFVVGPRGVEIETKAVEETHFEEKVDLPDSWVRGFLQLQSAMAMPGTRFEVDPVDFKTMLRYLHEHRAYTSPRSIRWEFEPGQDVRAVLEPWDEIVEMVGSKHHYAQPKTTRIWGRRRLQLIDKLIPYADKVEVYLKGRALPSFYAVRMPGVTVVLGLSGWTANHWSQEASFDLLSMDGVEEAWVDRALAKLQGAIHLDEKTLAAKLDCEVAVASQALTELCRRGRAIYDVRDREFRYRELFQEPIDHEQFYPPDPRQERSKELVSSGAVKLEVDEIREKQKISPPEEGAEPKVTVFRDRVLQGDVDGEVTHVVLQDTGRIIFGRCTCDFFDQNLLNRGPCSHMLALRRMADSK